MSAFLFSKDGVALFQLPHTSRVPMNPTIVRYIAEIQAKVEAYNNALPEKTRPDGTTKNANRKRR